MVARLTLQHMPHLRVLRLGSTHDDARSQGVTTPQMCRILDQGWPLRVLSLAHVSGEALDKLQSTHFQWLETLTLSLHVAVTADEDVWVSRSNALGRALTGMTALRDLSLTAWWHAAIVRTAKKCDAALDDWRLLQVAHLHVDLEVPFAAAGVRSSCAHRALAPSV